MDYSLEAVIARAQDKAEYQARQLAKAVGAKGRRVDRAVAKARRQAEQITRRYYVSPA